MDDLDVFNLRPLERRGGSRYRNTASPSRSLSPRVLIEFLNFAHSGSDCAFA
jgi:hypothetical protein